MATRYYLSLPDPKRARGADPDLAFHSQGAGGFAEELQEALRTSALFDRWCAAQDDPEGVDPSLGVTDPAAVVHGEQHDLHVDLVATTTLPGNVVRQRLRLLAGDGWVLKDVTAA